jgi:hypothetical protein
LALATTINATFMFASRYILVFAETMSSPRRWQGSTGGSHHPLGLLIMFILALAFLPLGATSFEVLAYTAPSARSYSSFHPDFSHTLPQETASGIADAPINSRHMDLDPSHTGTSVRPVFHAALIMESMIAFLIL